MPPTMEASSVDLQRSPEATKTIPSPENNDLAHMEGRQRAALKGKHPLLRRPDLSDVNFNGKIRRDAVRREAGVREARTAIRKEEQQGYTRLLRNEFLTPDRKGRCSAEGGNYREAFQHLLQRAGDPNQWRPEDMTRPEVVAVMNGYRAFQGLQGGRSLTFEQVGAMQQLHAEQQQINRQRIQADTSTHTSRDAVLGQQQQQLEQVKQALENYQPAAQNVDRVGSITWATPDQMGTRLTHAICELYKADLRMSDSERASMRFPNESVNEALQGKGDRETLLGVITEMLLAIAQAVASTPSADFIREAA